MAFAAIYWVFVIGTLAASWTMADKQSRILIFGAALAAILSFAAFLFEQSRAATLVGAIDCTLLALSCYIALTCDRFWPIWFAGFQAAAILTRIAAVSATANTRWVFQTLESFWVIPCLLVMVLGLTLDRRPRPPRGRNNRFVT